MQGFRRGGMQLGETACVVGLGLLGQILVRILRAAGINAVGVDLSRARCELAVAAGAALAGTPSDPGLLAAIRALTGGFGADAVFITAGGDTTGPVELAVQVARDRARVVDIGKTKIDLSWNDYYMKELDFVFSRSYGPGRYDPTYEERGVDYPIGYVRWTENRNMSSFLELIAQGRLDLASIITSIHPIAEAEAVYDGIARGEGGLGVLFQYPDEVALDRRLPSLATGRAAATSLATARVGVIGAGNYALSMLLPHLARDPRAKLVEVATRTPLSAANAQRRFPFERSSTDSTGLLQAKDVNAILIATRHASSSKNPWPSTCRVWSGCGRPWPTMVTSACRWASTAASRRSSRKPPASSRAAAFPSSWCTESTPASSTRPPGTRTRPKARVSWEREAISWTSSPSSRDRAR
jgi:Zinc-binding dehydrogenase